MRLAREGQGPLDGGRGGRHRALALAARFADLTAADLVEATLDADARVRRQACEIAARRPDLAVDLATLLADVEPLVAEAAAFALGERAANDAEVAALVGAATGAGHPLVREAAVAALGALGDERGRYAILAALDDVVTVRRRAVLALAPFAGPDIDAALAVAAEDRDWQVRNAARDIAG